MKENKPEEGIFMVPTCARRTIGLALTVLALMAGTVRRSHAQAAVLMEEPYGFFGVLNPTGHIAVYFAHICAETPVKLRRCEPGEQGTVIARYSGIAGYDWVAMPLIPYLYSVEELSDVPVRVDKQTVRRLRNRYHEDHLGYLGEGAFEGSFVRGGWTQLVGAAFERRIYAFRFATTDEQDEAVIQHLNTRANRSEFNLVYNNCADFARAVLNIYFPRTFRRYFFPDAGMTTPKQITYKLTKYSRKHPEIHLAVFQIPQVPGYRRISHSNKSVSASLITTGYVVPIFFLNPYVGGAIVLDYLTRGRFPSVPEIVQVLSPDELFTLQSPTGWALRAVRPVPQESNASATVAFQPPPASALPDPALNAIVTGHE
jgi:hypothetical protein